MSDTYPQETPEEAIAKARANVERALSLVVAPVPDEVVPERVELTVPVRREEVVDVMSGLAMQQLVHATTPLDIARVLVDEAHRMQPQTPVELQDAA